MEIDLPSIRRVHTAIAFALRGAAVALAIAAAVTPTAGPAMAQGVGLTQEVERLRRDLNDLQRHVYRGDRPGAGAPAGQPVAGDVAGHLQRQIQVLDDQLRTMTGQIEETQFAVRRLGERLDKLVVDVDARLQSLEQGRPLAGQQPAGAATGRPADSEGTTVITSQGISGPASPSTAPSSGATTSTVGQLLPGQRSLGTVDAAAVRNLAAGRAASPAGPRTDGSASPTPGPAAGPVAGPGASVGASGPGASVGASGQVASLPEASAKEQYDYAFEFLKQRDYANAQSALRAFVERHPDDDLSGNAIYWLGETYYVQKDFSEAARVFLDGYQRFPNGSKVPDNLLKLGMSLGQVGEKDSACATFRKLQKSHANAASRILSTADAEMRRLGCS